MKDEPTRRSETHETCENTVISPETEPPKRELSKKQKRLREKSKTVAKDSYPGATIERFVHEYLQCFRYLEAKARAGYVLNETEHEAKMLNSSRFRGEVVKQANELRLRVLSGVAREMKGTASMQAVETLTQTITKQYGGDRPDAKDSTKDGPRRGWGSPPPVDPTS